MREGGRVLKGKVVLDTGPLLLYFGEDKRAKEIIDDAGIEIYVCDLSLAELYYKTCEVFGREVADLRYTSIRNSGIISVATDERLTRDAGGIKCQHRGKISLADAYVVATTRKVGGILVTTDHVISDLGIVKAKLLAVP
ncbi:MAG: PIN domain-containing protein [Candidatus Bathyarchaeia archaeon]|jgi:predicted nucleic acid-binding protein